jgi:hypothetical protein
MVIAAVDAERGVSAAVQRHYHHEEHYDDYGHG